MWVLVHVPLGVSVLCICASNPGVMSALVLPIAETGFSRRTVHGGDNVGQPVVHRRLQLVRRGDFFQQDFVVAAQNPKFAVNVSAEGGPGIVFALN